MPEKLWKRILLGKKDNKEVDKKTSEEGPKDAALPEKILKTPISRRTILGGAATTAGHLASSGVQGPMVIQQGVSEMAARVSQKVSRIIDVTNQLLEISEPRDDSRWDYKNQTRIECTAPSIGEIFSAGVPRNSRGEMDLWTIDRKSTRLNSSHSQ